MGDGFDPLTTGSGAAAISNRGTLLIMVALVVVGTLGGSLFGGRSVGAGVLTGGILAVINYIWLDRSTRALFEQRASGATILLAAKYILRYAAIAAVLLFIYMTEVLPIAPVILGLSAFAVAVVIQGLKNIFTSSF